MALRDPSRLLRGGLRFVANSELRQAVAKPQGKTSNEVPYLTRETLRNFPCSLSLNTITLPDQLDRAAINVLKECRYTPKELSAWAHILCNHLWNRELPPDSKDARLKEIFREVSNAEADRVRQIEDESLEEDDGMTLGLVDKMNKKQLNSIVNEKVTEWRPLRYSNKICPIYLVGRVAPIYAVAYRVLKEINKRCPEFNPTTLFDFGAGLGTATWAAQSLWEHSLRECMLIDSSSEMISLAELLLRGGVSRRPFIFPGIYQRQFLPAKADPTYDIVIAGHSLLDVGRTADRVAVLETLWKKTEQFLVLIEQGTQVGFQTILHARDILLAQPYMKKSKQPLIFAPCPHSFTCGKSDSICNFSVKYRKFNLTSSASEVNSEVFSYLIMSKGPWPGYSPEDTALPRIVSYKLGRLLSSANIQELCTPSGIVERNVFSKAKTDKLLYQFLSKCQPGDLFPGDVVVDEESREMEVMGVQHEIDDMDSDSEGTKNNSHPDTDSKKD